MAAISAEGVVIFVHGDAKAGGHGFMTERQMAGALDQVLQKQVVRPLFAIADFRHLPIQREARGIG